MADEGLSKEEIAKIDAWLHKWWHQPQVCQVCGFNQWTVGTLVARLPVQNPEGGMELGKAYPEIRVVCRRCGYTVFFNAIVMGLAKGTPESQEQKTERPPATEAKNG